MFSIYYFYQAICYKYIQEEYLTWDEARENCKKLDADLFSIHSQQEQDLVESKII